MTALLALLKDPDVQRTLIRIFGVILGTAFADGKIPTYIDGAALPIGLAVAAGSALIPSRSPANIKTISKDPEVPIKKP